VRITFWGIGLRALVPLLITLTLLSTQCVESKDEFCKWPDCKDFSFALRIDIDEPLTNKEVEEINNLLKEKEVKATFFFSGVLINQMKEQIKYLERNGHEIALLNYYFQPFHKWLTSPKKEMERLYLPTKTSRDYYPEVNRGTGLILYKAHVNELSVREISRSMQLLDTLGIEYYGFGGIETEVIGGIPKEPGESRIKGFKYVSFDETGYYFPKIEEKDGDLIIHVPPTMGDEIDSGTSKDFLEILWVRETPISGGKRVSIGIRNNWKDKTTVYLDVLLPPALEELEVSIPWVYSELEGKYLHVLLRTQVPPNETEEVKISYKVKKELVEYEVKYRSFAEWSPRELRIDVDSGGIIEYPIIVWSPDVALETWKKKMDKIREKGGMATVRIQAKTILEVPDILEIVEYARQRGAWITLYRDIANWWSLKDSIEIGETQIFPGSQSTLLRIPVYNKEGVRLSGYPISIVLEENCSFLPDYPYKILEKDGKRIMVVSLDFDEEEKVKRIDVITDC